MKILRIIICAHLFLFAGGINAVAQWKYIAQEDTLPPHPRILMSENDVLKIRENIERHGQWAGIHRDIVAESDRLIDLPVLERIQVGRRLLAVSREALRRIFYLSYSYRLTGDERYAHRAEREMLAISEFTDWNPSHFLDVAEMTMAVSIGYDWTYDALPEESRRIITGAILRHGIDPAFNPEYTGHWLNSHHNWNQVCNAGITYGAIALYDEIPEISKGLIDRAIESIRLPMQKYGPDGAYPEGVVYWSYGTSFNVMFLSAVEKLFGSDFGLGDIQGFLPSASYVNNMISPRMEYFNYGDSGDAPGLSPTPFWFAARTGDVSLLWNEHRFMQSYESANLVTNRLLPAIMVWGSDIDPDLITAPVNRLWVGQGTTPVAAMRTSWTDPDAIYVGLKAGRAGSNHSHMDIGSFIMEVQGQRWAIDMGVQDYTPLELAGVDLWNRKQDSQRWDVYRYNNIAHGTLTFDGQKQNVDGHTRIDSYGDTPGFTFAVSDLTNANAGQVESARRGVAIVDDSHVVLRDEIRTGENGTRLRWSMVTRADVRIKGRNSMELRMNGRKLTFTVDATEDVALQTWPADPPNSYDEPNPGVTIIGFETDIPPGSERTYVVKLIPQGAKRTGGKTVPLAQWK